MDSPVVGENIFLLYSFGMGVFITFVYDIFRIGRRVCAHNRFWISLEDIFFWFFCAVSVFYMMHTQSNGTLRWFAIIGALLGMFLYKKTISPFLVKWVSFCLRTLLGWLAKPFQFVGRKCAKAGKTVACSGKRASGRLGAFLKKRLTASVKLLKIILCKH